MTARIHLASSVKLRRDMLSRRKLVALASSFAATAALLLVPAQAAYATTYVLRNTASGQMGCIQPPGFDRDAPLTTASCNGSDIQRWILDPVTFVEDGDENDLVVHFRNFATNLCMRASTNQDFAPVTQIDCTSISNLNWISKASGQIKSLISTGGRPCLDLQQGPSTTVAKPIDVFHCGNQNAAQIFTFTQAS